MKSIVKKLISIAVCLAMVIAFTLPAFADAKNIPEKDVTEEKLNSFLNQTTNDPYVTNKMEMWRAGNRAIAEFQEQYHGLVFGLENENYYIAPIFDTSTNSNGDIYISTVNFSYFYFCSDTDGNSVNTGLLEVKPDFYGPFDVSGTRLSSVNGPHGPATHISSVNVDDCIYLFSIDFNEQPYCTEFSALNCPHLYNVLLRDGAYKNIVVEPHGYNEPLRIVAVGSGSVGMRHTYAVDALNSNLYAYPTEELGFIGWFVGGRLVSTETDYVHQGGGKVYACFAGDVNGDGLINIMDANLIMRGSLNLAPMEEEALFDLDSNGIINTADALLAIRVGMGL